MKIQIPLTGWQRDCHEMRPNNSCEAVVGDGDINVELCMGPKWAADEGKAVKAFPGRNGWVWVKRAYRLERHTEPEHGIDTLVEGDPIENSDIELV